MPELNIKENFDKYIDLLDLLEKEKQNYNSSISDVNFIIKNLDNINNLLASYEIKANYEIFIKHNDEKSKQDNLLKEILTKKNYLEEQLTELELEKKNAKIAMDSINANLKYIFFSNNRLSIDFDNGRYILYSNGKRVKPENVSVGERNAIALCYFFNQIMKDKEEKDVYSLPYIIVIDDPVSSFDMDNRIGIITYLKYMISKFAIGNKLSKFLIMTHDLQFMFDVQKLIDEVSKNAKILDILKEPYKTHFENFMYRLVLNGCSHMEDRVKTLNDLNFFNYISDSEKQLTAKNILCFIYMLNPLNLLFHFGDKANDVEKDIKKWCDEIIAS